MNATAPSRLRPGRWRRTRLGAAALGSVVVLAGACSLVIDPGLAEQCTEDAQCERFAEPGAERMECKEGVCLPVGASGCVSNSQCVAENDGLPFMCVRPGEKCVSLINEQCTEVEGNYEQDNTIVFGHMMAHSGAFQFTSPHHQASSRLALKEFDKAINGLPGANNQGRRHMVMVSCNEMKDPQASARFLVDELNVKAIIGVMNAENVVKVAEVTVPKNVLLIGHAASPFVVNLDDDGLVFSTVSDLSQSMFAYPSIIAELEAQIRQERSLAPADSIKVAILASDRLDENAKTSRLFETDFTFNGKTWQENEEAENFKLVRYADPAVEAVDFSIPADAVHKFEPDIVLGIYGPEFDTELGPLIEDNWDIIDGKPRPYWVLPNQTPAVLTLFTKEDDVIKDPNGSTAEDRRRRVRGVNYVQHDKQAYDQWVLRFKGELDIAPGPWVEARYDAVYALAYAYMMTRNIAQVTGKDLAAALLKLNPPGAPILTKQDDILSAQNVLAAGGEIDLSGIYSDMDFEPTTGWVTTNAGVFCITSELKWAQSGLVYLTNEKKMSGVYSCP